MLYLTNTTDAQVVFLPRVATIRDGATLTFTAKSTVGLDTPVSVRSLDLGDHRVYLSLAISLPEDLTPGEYEYNLAVDGTSVSTGLLVIGEYTSDITGQYDKTITYEQYNG